MTASPEDCADLFTRVEAVPPPPSPWVQHRGLLLGLAIGLGVGVVLVLVFRSALLTRTMVMPVALSTSDWRCAFCDHSNLGGASACGECGARRKKGRPRQERAGGGGEGAAGDEHHARGQGRGGGGQALVQLHPGHVGHHHVAHDGVVVDGGARGQVFLNLLLNAADALPDGHADLHTVTVDAARVADGVVVRITDTGAGMTAAMPVPGSTAAAGGAGVGAAPRRGLSSDLHATSASAQVRPIAVRIACDDTSPAAVVTRSAAARRSRGARPAAAGRRGSLGP